MNTKQLHWVLTESAAFYENWDAKIDHAKAKWEELQHRLQSMEGDHDKHLKSGLRRRQFELEKCIDNLYERKFRMVDEIGVYPADLAKMCQDLIKNLDDFHNTNPRQTGNVLRLQFLGIPSNGLEDISSMHFPCLPSRQST